MTKDRIKQLMQSSNSDDVEIAIHFLGSYRIKEIREIIPGGKWNEKNQIYEVLIRAAPKFEYIKFSHFLYLAAFGFVYNFHSKPKKFTKYISLYEKT